jgi:protein BCP1
MYNMLLEEISWALEEKEPYQFSHYLVISKAYTEMESDLPGNDRPQKKSKKSKGSAGKEVFLFHAEDEILQRHALAHGSYEYSTQEGEGASDSKRAFQDLGIRPQGSLILIEAGKLGATVKALTDFVSPA